MTRTTFPNIVPTARFRVDARTHVISAIVAAAALVAPTALAATSDGTHAGGTDGAVFAGFLPEQLIPTAGGEVPASVAFGDFNGDGIADMAVGDQTSDTFDDIQIFLGIGDGSFGPPALNGVGGLPVDLAVADINLDGRLDIVSANRESNDVSFLQGNGDGTFLPEQFFGVDTAPNAIAAADVNGDGLPDIVTGNLDADSISVLIGDGTGGAFTRTDYSTTDLAGTAGVRPIDIVLADLNNDTAPDVAVAAQSDNRVVVMYNVGDGSFFTGDFASFYSVGDFPIAIESIDANGDGWMDIVNTNTSDNTVSVLTNNVDGFYPTFLPGSPIAVPGGPADIAVSDLNLDGIDDLAVTGVATGADHLQVLLGDGLGGFVLGGPWSVQLDPTSVAIADFDRDGDPDVATGNINDSSISILLNRTNLSGGPLPEAFIASPTHVACQCGAEDVFGIADVGLGYFDRWDLEYRHVSDDAWTPLAESGTPVPSPGGPLAAWDTSLLPEGRYLLRLTVTSITGLTSTDEVVVWVSRDFDAATFDFLWGNIGMPSVATVVAGTACPVGTVSDGGCGGVTYTVDQAPLGTSAWTPVDPGNPSYAGGRVNTSLATWDTIAAGVSDGDYDVRLEGLNACGQQGLAFRTIRVDNTPPVSSLSAPAPCTVFQPGDLVEIRGTASDANFLDWHLDVIGGPYTGWHTLASGGSQVVNNTFAMWDTNGLPTCGYVLRLRARDAAIPNCGSSPRDTIVYRAIGLGANGCLFTDGLEIGGTENWGGSTGH